MPPKKIKNKFGAAKLDNFSEGSEIARLIRKLQAAPELAGDSGSESETDVVTSFGGRSQKIPGENEAANLQSIRLASAYAIACLPILAVAGIVLVITTKTTSPSTWVLGAKDPKLNELAELNRGSIASIVSMILVNGVGARMNSCESFIKKNKDMFAVNIGYVFSNLFGYFMDRGLGSGKGLALLNKGFGGKDKEVEAYYNIEGDDKTFTNYILQAFSRKPFFRFVTTVLLDMFISETIQDGIKYTLDTAGTAKAVASWRDGGFVPNWYIDFVKQNWGSILQSLVAVLTFFAYTNQTRFNWAYPDVKAARIPDLVIQLSLALATGIYISSGIKEPDSHPNPLQILRGGSTKLIRLIFSIMSVCLITAVGMGIISSTPPQPFVDNDESLTDYFEQFEAYRRQMKTYIRQENVLPVSGDISTLQDVTFDPRENKSGDDAGQITPENTGSAETSAEVSVTGTNGSGSGATVTFKFDSQDAVESVTIVNVGSGYRIGDILEISNTNLVADSFISNSTAGTYRFYLEESYFWDSSSDEYPLNINGRVTKNGWRNMEDAEVYVKKHDNLTEDFRVENYDKTMLAKFAMKWESKFGIPFYIYSNIMRMKLVNENFQAYKSGVGGAKEAITNGLPGTVLRTDNTTFDTDSDAIITGLKDLTRIQASGAAGNVVPPSYLPFINYHLTTGNADVPMSIFKMDQNNVELVSEVDRFFNYIKADTTNLGTTANDDLYKKWFNDIISEKVTELKQQLFEAKVGVEQEKEDILFTGSATKHGYFGALTGLILGMGVVLAGGKAVQGRDLGSKITNERLKRQLAWPAFYKVVTVVFSTVMGMGLGSMMGDKEYSWVESTVGALILVSSMVWSFFYPYFVVFPKYTSNCMGAAQTPVGDGDIESVEAPAAGGAAPAVARRKMTLSPRFKKNAALGGASFFGATIFPIINSIFPALFGLKAKLTWLGFDKNEFKYLFSGTTLVFYLLQFALFLFMVTRRGIKTVVPDSIIAVAITCVLMLIFMLVATFRRAKDWGTDDMDEKYWDFTDYGWAFASSMYVAMAPTVGMIAVAFIPKATESESGLLTETGETGVPAGLARQSSSLPLDGGDDEEFSSAQEEEFAADFQQNPMLVGRAQPAQEEREVEMTPTRPGAVRRNPVRSSGPVAPAAPPGPEIRRRSDGTKYLVAMGKKKTQKKKL